MALWYLHIAGKILHPVDLLSLFKEISKLNYWSKFKLWYFKSSRSGKLFKKTKLNRQILLSDSKNLPMILLIYSGLIESLFFYLRRAIFSPHSGGKKKPAMLSMVIMKLGIMKLNVKNSVRLLRWSVTSMREKWPSWPTRLWFRSTCVPAF